MTNQFSEVHCYYTGGGVYVYSARYGNNFLYGTLDQTIDCYSVRGEVLFHDRDACQAYKWLGELYSFPSSVNEAAYYISPNDIEYPTWQDILDSLRLDPDEAMKNDSCRSLQFHNPDLSKRTYEE